MMVLYIWKRRSQRRQKKCKKNKKSTCQNIFLVIKYFLFEALNKRLKVRNGPVV